MSVLSSRPVLRWLVPATAAIAVLGGGAALKAVTAAAAPSLPPRTAAQLLVDVQTARLDGLSGTVVQQADLGLPALPGLGGAAGPGGQGSSALSSLISGTHTLRVWYSGPTSARIALLGTLGESDIITNGHDLWTWSSRTNTATHRVLPAGSAHRPMPDPSALPLTPQQAADAALAAIDPTTEVTTAGPTRVAGRSAYELVLTPRDAASLVGQVRLAIDAIRHVPLRVQVYPDGPDASPAIEVAFTQISFTRPGPEQFTFTPPPGAKVTEESRTAPGPGVTGMVAPQATMIGKGWTAVLAARLPGGVLSGTPDGGPSTGQTSGPAGGGQLTTLLHSLPKVSGAWGSGRMLSGSLFSVLLTDDGRVLVGAVRPARLLQAAADPAAALKGGK